MINQHAFCQYENNPNADPNWDWTASSYTFYLLNIATGTIVANPFDAPWSQQNAWAGLQDNKKEDGWKLVARDFGTPGRAIWSVVYPGSPFFILYNENRGILRYFVFAQAQSEYTYGALTVKFGNNIYNAALAHVNNRSLAIDKLSQLSLNKSTSLVEVYNGGWVWADIPMAYDPTIVPTDDGSWLDFKLEGIDETDISINGIGTGANGQSQDVRTFMTGQHGSPSVPTDAPSVTNNELNFDALKSHVLGTQANWSSFTEFLNSMNTKTPTPNSGDPLYAITSFFKSTISSLLVDYGAESLPAIGAAVGFVDYLVSGGKSTDKQKAGPTYFGMNVELKGNAKTIKLLPNPKRISVPGSKLNPEREAYKNALFPLLYNKPVGLFNLKKTVAVEYKNYNETVLSGGINITAPFVDLRIKDNLDWVTNSSNDLQLDSLRAWIVADVSNVKNFTASNLGGYAVRDRIASWVKKSNPTIALESAVEGKYVFKSIPIDGNTFKYQTIKVPGPITELDIAIKLKAVYHRKSDPTALPVVFIATYQPDLIDAGTGNWPTPPLPFIVNVSRAFESGETQVLQSQSGYLGADNVTISTPATINNSTFVCWSDGSRDLTRTINSSANLVAFYKAKTISNTQSAFSNTGQRKFIRTSDGYLHLVYESMNKIWYERSTDGGATWTIQNNGKPLNTDYKRDNLGNIIGTGSYTFAKHPSMDYLGNNVVITWQEQSGTGYVIRLAFMNNGIPTNVVNNIPFTTSYGQYSEDVTPILAIKESNNSAILALKRNDSNFKGIECHYLALDPLNGISSEYGFGAIPGTNANSKNITIATDKASTDKFHVSWQQDGSGYSDVNYARFNFVQSSTGTTGLNVLTSAVSAASAPGNPVPMVINVLLNNCISSPTYNTYNYSPSIIAANDGSARVSFKGYYEYDPGYGNYAMSLVNPDNFSYIPYLNKYGGYIYSSQLSLGSDTYFMGWTEFYNNAYRTICTDSHTLSDMETVNNAYGKDFQINNGGSKDQQYVMTFNSESSTLPYSFRRSDAIGSIVSNKRSSISRGRSIFLTKDNAQLHFILGNVNADGVNVNFVDVQDTVKFDNIGKVNSYLITEPFNITDNSTFNFAVSYGSKDSVLAKSYLQDDKYCSFKVELVEANSGKVLGSYLNVTMNKDNIFKMKEASYKVSGIGAGSQMVKLRLSVDENMNSQYTVSDMLLGKGILLSKSSVEENELNYKGALEVKDFALEQNYPNPFNPSTTISYALPKAAYVSLKVYDVLGKEVKTLVNEYKVEGKYSVEFNANSLPSGIYVYQLKAGNNIVSRKMMLVK
ncbi:MAG: T9SS type A sorting domain-containing protein [Bacteroidota bacterium]|nr:T9SS type A sorting domain-containing protein [Bacteroidota bacterium]MDP4197191.1 T9SS type A sorting domain-containing protein [Bacteroidota bacterium]